MDQAWGAVVAEALTRGINDARGAVPGAKLRQLISAVAKEHKLSYPPSEEPQIKFADFLKKFDHLLVTLKRQAQDVLVAPKDRPELLLETASEEEQAQLRDDVFEAFTFIPKGTPRELPWYDKLTDRFLWIREGTEVDQNALVSLTPASRDQEINSRTAFLTLPDIAPETRDALLPTLGTHSALWAFSQGIKTRGLGKKWHKYRFQEVLRRLRQWTEAFNIPWKEDWIIDRRLAKFDSHPEIEAIKQQTPQLQNFEEVFRNLTNEDMSRIMIPLDIVLKIRQR